MQSSAMAYAAGAALRPVTGRCLPHTPFTSAAATRSLATTPARCHSLLRQYHSQRLTRALKRTHTPPLTIKTRLQSTHAKRNPRRRTFISPRYLPVLILLAVAGVAWDSQWLFPSAPPDPAAATILGDARKFTRFDVVARDQVSPTSFILTLRAPLHSLPGVASLWDVFDLWCVEVKQPQIQVAREYTPIPPSSAGAGADRDALRLYVRAVRGGEVSTYLSRLSPAGDTVELRGPHGEFDLRSRLGRAGDRVVFLAGGTGIASALQAAEAVLSREGTSSMTIFWAVRSRDEVQSCGVDGVRDRKPAKSSWSWNPFSGKPRESTAGIQAEALAADARDPSPISRQLLALKEKYGGRLDVRVVVDQEGTRVQEPDLAAALTTPSRRPKFQAADDCKFHSQAAHVGMVDGAPNAGRRFLFKDEDCACPSKESTGKNLFVVSGPEGFVQAHAGPKIWRDGGQLQGPVGGMLGRMQRGNPELLKDWIVLKL